MIKDIWIYLKKPTYTPFTEQSALEKRNFFVQILVIAVGASFILGLLMAGVTSFLEIDLGQHGVELIFQKLPLIATFAIVVLLAPFLEELLFRAPLAFFKDSRFFHIIFYLSFLIFGAIHLTNFELYASYFWLAPLLIAPQTVAGIFLGYTRVKLGLSWAIALHACHNAILLAPALLVQLLGQTTNP